MTKLGTNNTKSGQDPRIVDIELQHKLGLKQRVEFAPTTFNKSLPKNSLRHKREATSKINSTTNIQNSERDNG